MRAKEREKYKLKYKWNVIDAWLTRFEWRSNLNMFWGHKKSSRAFIHMCAPSLFSISAVALVRIKLMFCVCIYGCAFATFLFLSEREKKHIKLKGKQGKKWMNNWMSLVGKHISEQPKKTPMKVSRWDISLFPSNKTKCWAGATLPQCQQQQQKQQQKNIYIYFI